MDRDSFCDEENLTLTINEDFANRYDKWRSKEELQKYKDRYGDKLPRSSDESSSSESEDDNAEELTPDVEVGFLKTLSCLKSGDPKRYDKNVTFFKPSKPTVQDNELRVAEKKSKEKSMTIRDYDRVVMLEKGGIFESDDEDVDDHTKSDLQTYTDEQKELKNDFLKAASSIDDSTSGIDNFGGFLNKKIKTVEEKAKEEADYLEWLKGKKDHLENTNEENDLKCLHEYWNDPKLDPKEKYLRDFILNKRYLFNSDGKAPVYQGITEGQSSDEEIEDILQDEEEVEKQEEFEMKYNFRHQDPDPDFIKSYPRDLKTSVRRKDTKRSEKRQEIQDRKKAAKDRRTAELKHLKNLQRAELEEKLSKIEAVSGDANLSKIDLDGDFNPDEYDSMMQKVFNEGYYDVAEQEKPEVKIDDDDEDLQFMNWDEWDGDDPTTESLSPLKHKPNSRSVSCGDDQDESGEENTDEGASMDDSILVGKKKKRRKSAFAELMEHKRPRFDPAAYKKASEYFDQYYAMDFEDLVGDVPCRMKYRQVTPNNFGLSTDEILLARDKELNQWVSVKKCMQYRTDREEQYDVKAYEEKGKEVFKKKKIMPSLFDEDDAEEPAPKKKRRRRRGKVNQVTELRYLNPVTSPKGSIIKPKEGHGFTNIGGNVTVETLPSNIATEQDSKPTTPLSKEKGAWKKTDKLKKTKESKPVRQNAKPMNMIERSLAAKNADNKKKSRKKDLGVLNDERLSAYGINPKKFWKKQKYTPLNSESNVNDA